MSEGLIAFCGCIILFLVLYLMALSQEKKRKFNKYYDISEKSMKNYEHMSSSEIKNTLSEMQSVYQETKDALPKSSRKCYQYDVEDLQDRLNELEMARWEKKALPHLEKFAGYWNEFTCGDIEVFDNIDTFRYSEYFIKLQKKCINEWQSYFAIPLDSYKITIRPKQYMKEYMGDEYDLCMESHAALEKRLSSIIDHMRPEYERKKKLLRKITAYVRENGSIQRSELFKVDFTGYSKQEVRYGYKELVKKNKLVEVKIGDRYFVSLPLSKTNNQK